MNKLTIFLLCVLFTVMLASQSSANDVKILALVAENFGAGLYLNQDEFAKYGWDITLVGITETVTSCNSTANSPIDVDLLVSEVTDITQYDVFVIMPSSWQFADPYVDIMASPEALELVADAVDSNLIVWITCAGARVLAAADRLNGVEILAQPGNNNVLLDEYEAAGAIYLGNDSPPVVDGNIISCVQHWEYRKQNIQAIATALENQNEYANQKGEK